MANKIAVLIENPDNIEKIRDQVSAILKIETAAQYAMALAAGAADAGDYRIGIWQEKSRPWQINEDAEKKNPFPLVNVSLMGFHADGSGGPAVGQKKYTGEIYLDCYASGEFTADESDDTDSARRAWKVGRVIRNILSSEQYSYLGLRGIVRDIRIVEGKTGDPRNQNENSAQSVTICRLVLQINYYEDTPQASPAEFEEYNFVASSPSGEVLFDMTGVPGVNEDKEEQV
jgi:hypothetical protein